MSSRHNETVSSAQLESVFSHSATPVTNRSQNNVVGNHSNKTITFVHFKSDISSDKKNPRASKFAIGDVAFCSVHKPVASSRSQSDVPGDIPGDPGQPSWACLEDARSSGLTRPLEITTRLRAPETSACSHRTESPYRLLSHATSGRSHSVSRTQPQQSNRSFESNNSSSSSAPKLHPRSPLKKNNATVAHNAYAVHRSLNDSDCAVEPRNLFHDNSCSLYSLDELDALRGHPRPPASARVVDVQPVRSYADTRSRNNNDYSECPMEILNLKRSGADAFVSRARTASENNAQLCENENAEFAQQDVCKKSSICSKCGRCRLMCCAPKRAHLLRTYVGRQEVSAECAIDWCTCMLCAHAILDCIPDVPDATVDDEKKLRALPCACCAARNYQLWCCCLRWTAVSLMCLPCFPCLVAYWPLRGVERAFSRCFRRSQGSEGCRCDEEVRVDFVDPTEFWINSEDSVDESDSRT